MVQNTFLLEYFKTIWYLYQLKNALYILVTLLKFICKNLTVYNAKIKDIEDEILDITNLATNTTLKY